MWSLIGTRSELELPRSVERAADVASPHRRGQAVVHVVRPRDRLVVVGEALHRDDRAEDLALDDLVGLADIDDHRRLDEEVAGTTALRHTTDARACHATKREIVGLQPAAEVLCLEAAVDHEICRIDRPVNTCREPYHGCRNPEPPPCTARCRTDCHPLRQVIHVISPTVDLHDVRRGVSNKRANHFGALNNNGLDIVNERSEGS